MFNSEQPRMLPILKPEVQLKWYSVKQLTVILGISRNTILNQVKNKTFPEPVKFSPRIVKWKAQDIDEWLNKKEHEGYVPASLPVNKGKNK